MLMIFALSLFGTMIDTAEIPIHHQRPSNLLKRMTDPQGHVFMGEGLVITAYDDRRAFFVEGSKEAIEGFKLNVRLFDISPITINVRYDLTSVASDCHYRGTVQIRNDCIWTYADDDTNLSFTVHPKVLANGDFQVILNLPQESVGIKDRTYRLTPEESFYAMPGATGHAKLATFSHPESWRWETYGIAGTKEFKPRKDEMPWLLRLTFSGLDDSGHP